MCSWVKTQNNQHPGVNSIEFDEVFKNYTTYRYGLRELLFGGNICRFSFSLGWQTASILHQCSDRVSSVVGDRQHWLSKRLVNNPTASRQANIILVAERGKYLLPE